MPIILGKRYASGSAEVMSMSPFTYLVSVSLTDSQDKIFGQSARIRSVPCN